MNTAAFLQNEITEINRRLETLTIRHAAYVILSDNPTGNNAVDSMDRQRVHNSLMNIDALLLLRKQYEDELQTKPVD